MMRRRRPLMRAAVVGGGAYVAGRRHGEQIGAGGRPERPARRPRAAAGTASAGLRAAQRPPAAAPAAGPSLLDQLNQLDALHQQGALTDNEFTAAKAKLLGN